MAMTATAIATALYLTMSVCIEAKLQAGAVNEFYPADPLDPFKFCVFSFRAPLS